MSDQQVLAFFDHERNEDNSPKLTIPTGRKPTSRYLHDRRCFDLGITEPEDVERLWQEKQARERSEEEPSKKRGRKRG